MSLPLKITLTIASLLFLLIVIMLPFYLVSPSFKLSIEKPGIIEISPNFVVDEIGSISISDNHGQIIVIDEHKRRSKGNRSIQLPTSIKSGTLLTVTSTLFYDRFVPSVISVTKTIVIP